MNAALRHLCIRMWLTALTGGMVSIVMLPWWQQALGVEGLIFPAVIIIGACFAALGWGMNRIGLGFLNRHVNEATAWERAGMKTEAKAAFQKAMATFDSFWLSPLQRRRKSHWFSSVMARFYLGQHSSQSAIRSLVSTHLKCFPQDKAVAEPWLEQMLAYERHLSLEHDAAASVSACMVNHQRIQRLLMQFYLANGRIDFDAVQTYRRVWNEQQPLSNGLLTDLSHLLCNEFFLNAWALQVYIEAYEKGDQGAIEGIAAAVRWLPENEESRCHLQVAKKILGLLDPHTLDQLDARFKPVHLNSPVKEKTKPKYLIKPEAPPLPPGMVSGFRKKANTLIHGFRRCSANRHLQRATAVIALGTGLTVAAVAGWKHLQHRSGEPVAQEVAKVQLEITDPFTIQVAAYLKAEDAQRFVDQLRQNELDAFLTRVTNAANRTWYQVKVSHFADRQGAEQYGQVLKTKGLIDDFYVANYEHAQRHDHKN